MPRCLSDRKIKEKEITIMKKFIKNYLAKLQENDKKGFSLVELIIVMAIMAILVGIVASQVLPYMDKSRQSKDQQVLSSICTDLVSATAQSGKALESTAAAGVDVSADSWGNADWNKVRKQYADLQNIDTSGDSFVLPTYASFGLGSKEAKKDGKKILFTYDSSSGKVTVFLSGHVSDDPDSSKYIVTSSSKSESTSGSGSTNTEGEGEGGN
jgi:type IV pilus assembly protein PilA